MRGTFALLCLICLPLVAGAAPHKSDKALQRWADGFQWQAVKGHAIDISSTVDDVVYAVGEDQRVYRWRQDRGWRLLPGTFSRISVDAQNKPWAIDSEGQVRRFNGIWWDVKGQFSDAPLDVAAAPSNEQVYALTAQGEIVQWQEKEERWEDAGVGQPEGLSGTVLAKSLTVDSQNRVWLASLGGALFYYDGQRWQSDDQSVKSIASGQGGELFAVGGSGELLLRGERAWLSVEAPKPASLVSVGKHGVPWFVSQDGSIYVAGTLQNSKDLEKVESASVIAATDEGVSDLGDEATEAAVRSEGFTVISQRAEPTAEVKNYRFIEIDDSASQSLAIGSDGSVYSAASDGQLQRWSNGRRQFLDFPGVLKQVAVDAFGLPWGINPAGDVYRIDNKRWDKIEGIEATRIDIGFGGGVVIVTPTDSIYQFSPTFNRFERIHGLSGQDVAVDPQGNLWVLESNGRIRYCPEYRCQLVPGLRAKSIDIGPEGSLFAVSDDNRLYRYLGDGEDASRRWDYIHRPVKQVAVGPEGFPWVIEASGNIAYSALFQRDEGQDLLLSLNIQGSTVDQDNRVGGFVISRNLRFSQENLPRSAGAGLSLDSSAYGDLFLLSASGASSASSNAATTTWVNQLCLDNPGDNNCTTPTDCGGNTTGACAPCNNAQNQLDGSTCASIDASTVVSNPVGDFVNGYCLFFPADPDCMMPGQPGGSAANVDCLDPGNQIHNVCVQVGNDLTGGSAGGTLGTVWRYEASRKRFVELRNIPDDAVALSRDQEGRMWWVTTDGSVLRETRENSERYRPVLGMATGSSVEFSPKVSAGGDAVYVLNNLGELFVYNESRDRLEREYAGLVFSDLSVDNQGQLWLERNNAVMREENGRIVQATRPIPQASEVIRSANNGELYIVNEGELLRFNSNRRRFESIRFSYGEVFSAAADERGRLWLLSQDGKLYQQQ
ncbi:hypothetical protein GP5015_334 [gamma proteobacterium HTCC5015]|nr:hypothetical protein GP5015_334 [gamma proteobacterium HTCC5015]